MRGIERIEMMGNLTASIVSHFGDTFLTVRSEEELSALRATSVPLGNGQQPSVPEGLWCSCRAPYNRCTLKSSAEGRELLSLQCTTGGCKPNLEDLLLDQWWGGRFIDLGEVSGKYVYTCLIKTYFSLHFLCVLQFFKKYSVVPPQKNSGYGSFTYPPTATLYAWQICPEWN